MKQKHNPNITKLFKGFRVGKRRPYKLNLKLLEKKEILSDLQRNIAEVHLGQCTEKTDPILVARILALTEKPIYKAKVNYLGNPIKQEEKK